MDSKICERDTQRWDELWTREHPDPIPFPEKVNLKELFGGPIVPRILAIEAVLTPRQPYFKDKAFVNMHHGEVLCGGTFLAGNPSATPRSYWLIDKSKG